MRFARCTPPMQFYATAYARVSTCSANNKRKMCSTVSRMNFQMRLLPTMRLACVCIFLLAHMSTSFASAGNTSAVSRMHSVMLQNVTSLSKEYQRLPLLGKCCPLNEILMKNTDEDSECVLVPPNDSSLVPFSPLFSPFNRTGILYPGDKVEEFVALIGSPCRYGRYMLYPEQTSDDDYYLMLNGSVFAPRHEPTMLAPGQDYCMEVVPEMGLRLLVCFPKENASPAADSRIIIYACGLLISVPFLILTIAAYTITPKLRDVHGKALCHYCGCLALAFTTLAITQLASAKLPPEVCISIAFVIQFSFVTCFFWLNVICIETWLLVRHHVNHRSYTRMHPKRLLFYYSIWAWIPPAILIVISIAMDLSPTIPMTYVKPTFGSESCWFKSDMEAMPYFYVPVSLLLLANIVLFVMTSVKITRYQQELARRRQERNENSNREDQRLFRRLKRTFFVCLVLFFLMGLNWTMELISWWVGGDPLDWSIFDLVNALQGLLIFGLFVMRRPVRDFIWHRVQKLRGIHAAEPEVGSMDLALLPMINSSHERGTTRLVA